MTPLGLHFVIHNAMSALDSTYMLLLLCVLWHKFVIL